MRPVPPHRSRPCLTGERERCPSVVCLIAVGGGRWHDDIQTVGVATDRWDREGCPPLAGLLDRFEAAGGRYLVCPICFDARKLDKGDLVGNAELGGTVPMWDWIGDDAATTFSY
jgi:hypothetical protein